MSKTNSYIPGVCNIGPAERRIRRAGGIISAIVGIALLIFLVMIEAPWEWRLLLVIPFSSAAMGFLQDGLHFCAGFGLRGIYNVINSAGVTDNIELEEYRRKDRRKAQFIVAASLAIGIILALASRIF